MKTDDHDLDDLAQVVLDILATAQLPPWVSRLNVLDPNRDEAVSVVAISNGKVGDRKASLVVTHQPSVDPGSPGAILAITDSEWFRKRDAELIERREADLRRDHSALRSP
jgi:hypothetical protein